MRSLRKRLLAVGLCAVLTVNTTVQGFTGGLGMQKIGGGNGPTEPIFFDALDAIGNTTATIGCILNIGSTLANADWSDPGGVCLSLVDTVFGTSFGGDPVQDSLDAIYSDVEEIKNTTNKISDGVDYLKANTIYFQIYKDHLNTVGSGNVCFENINLFQHD